MSKTLAPSVTARDPKGLKFISIVEAAYNKAGLPEEEAQRVNESPGLSDLVSSFIAENRLTDRFKDEEVRSSYTYPKEYKGPRLIEEQITALARVFDLDPSQSLEFAENLPELPEGAEGWFAIPLVDALAKKHFPEVTDPAEKYCRAVQLVHKKIVDSRSFYNYRQDQIDAAHLRVHTRTAQMMDQIVQTQKGDILIIAGQLGMRHRGRSDRRVREVFTTNEFGLTSLAVGSIVLTHPERLVRWEELDMDCAGDEFSDGGVDRFEHAPCFDFYVGWVEFVTRYVGSAVGDYGSASGFAPQ